MISRKKSDSTHPTPDMNWDHKTHSNASTWLNLHNLGLIHKFQSKKWSLTKDPTTWLERFLC